MYTGFKRNVIHVESMERRKYLAITGGTIALAGCSSDGSSESEPEEGNGEQESESEEQETEPEENNQESEEEQNQEQEEEEEEPEPASFEVVEYDIPETVEIGEEVTLSVTVRNVGGQEGDLSVPIYGRTPDSSWQEGGEVSLIGIGSGENATAEVGSIEYNYLNRYEYRLGTSSKTVVVQTVSAKISWGEEYTTPAGYRIQVDEPNLQDTYEYEDYQGNIVDKEPDSGDQWAFVNVWVKNETGQTSFSPLASEFGLLYGNSQSDGDTLLIDEPINKGESFEGGELQPDVERNGWIAYQLPGDISTNDLTMAWSQETIEGQIAANWGDE